MTKKLEWKRSHCAKKSYRASCNGVEIQLRVNVDNAWIVIQQPGREAFYRDIPQNEVADVLAQFDAINGDPERFKAFVASQRFQD